MTIHFFAVVALVVVVFRRVSLEVTFVTWILRAFMAVDVSRDIPRILLAQLNAFAQRHVLVDEVSRGVDAVHTCAPVVRVFTP